jgi:predicted nucleic acid-binding protein
MNRTPGILLDTTVVIDVLRNRNQRRQFVADLINSRQTLVTSTVTIAEIYAGIRSGEEQATRKLLSDLDWFPVSAVIAERAGELKASFRRQGQTRSITDMIVAATALEHGFIVATDNRKDFQIPGLMLYPLP